MTQGRMVRGSKYFSDACGFSFQAREIMSALMPFMHILEQGGKLIQVIKHACSLKGLPSGPVRR